MSDNHNPTHDGYTPNNKAINYLSIIFNIRFVRNKNMSPLRSCKKNSAAIL